MLVSIIIPLYNSQNFIEETIESALNQSYGNIEVIVVDDHSTDDSFKIVKQNVSDRVILVKNKGKGACAARNYGFEISKGDYIQYLDADDLLSKNKIESQMNILRKEEENSLCSCSFSRFYKKNRVDAVLKKQEINKSYDNPIDWLMDSWTGKGMGQTSIWLTKRTLHTKAGKWNEDLSKNQDGDFFTRVILASKSIYFDALSMVYYRSTGLDSISKKITYDSALSTFRSYKLYENYLESFEHINLKYALANNFYSFLIYYYPHFEDLQKKSKDEIYRLGYKLTDFNKNSITTKLSKIIGFENVLKIKQLVKFR